MFGKLWRRWGGGEYTKVELKRNRYRTCWVGSSGTGKMAGTFQHRDEHLG